MFLQFQLSFCISGIFSYHEDFDKNGVLFGLATSFGTKPWANPVESEKVCVKRSSESEGHTAQIANHTILGNRSCCTGDEKNSWWQISFTSNQALFVSHYTLRHGRGDGAFVLKNWQFQGSNDGKEWTTLDTHKKSSSLPQKSFSSHTFRIKGEVTAWRHFRVLQTGMNSSKNYQFYLAGLELYGLLVQLKEAGV